MFRYSVARMTDRPAPWTYGDPISPQEYMAIRAKCITRRRRHMPNPAQFLAAFHAAAPMLLEHEVNRLRGYAFDGGEPGFEFQRINEGT